MGRKPSIDKAALLEAAEQIILERGASALSFDAIAKAAGVSKGGVQGVFKTKAELLQALYDHLDSGFEERFTQSKAMTHSAVQAYVKAVGSAESVVNQRVVALSLAVTQETEGRECLRQWYADAFRSLSTATESQRRDILRLCALEGALMLRYMNLLPLTEEDWARVFTDLLPDDRTVF